MLKMTITADTICCIGFSIVLGIITWLMLMHIDKLTVISCYSGK
jgi:hypothetical protein